jgi:hypothetical protein
MPQQSHQTPGQSEQSAAGQNPSGQPRESSSAQAQPSSGQSQQGAAPSQRASSESSQQSASHQSGDRERQSHGGDRESGRQAGNGDREQQFGRELVEQGEQIFDDVRAFAGSLRNAADDWQRLLRQRLERQPYAVLAIAAGAGYVLGGGLPRGLTKALFTMAVGQAIQHGLPSLPELMESGANTQH